MDQDVITADRELAKIRLPRRKRDKNTRNASEKSPFYSLQQVLELVPVSRSTLYLMIQNGEFPPQIKLGKRAAAWGKADVHNWIDKKLGA